MTRFIFLKNFQNYKFVRLQTKRYTPFIQIFFIVISAIVFSYWLSSCANIVPPEGGTIDTIPPKLLSEIPADSSLQIKVKAIVLQFDKYMELGDLTQLTVSPQLAVNPMVEARLKKVIITFPDSVLKDNTTYTVSLGNMLKDNREGTPYPDYTFTFSTGAYFDTLSIHGYAFNARNVTTDTSLKAILYDAEDFTDSIVFQKKPLYITSVSPDGNFRINNLPERNFRLFIIKDPDRNGTYDPGKDEIGFMQDVIRPAYMPDTTYTIRYFRENVDTAAPDWGEDQELSSTKPGKRIISGIQLKEDELYRVSADTVNTERGTQEINRPLSILISPKVANVHKDKIFLSFEKESVDIEAIADVEIKDSVILLHTQWQEASKYTLRLVKGWASDSVGHEVMPGKYLFMTKKAEDYGIVRLFFPPAYLNQDYLVQLFRDKDSVTIRPLTDTVLKFDFLSPGMYRVLLIQDRDQNGYWTTGDYLKKIQPEEVLIHQTIINVRPGWEMEETFKGTAIPVGGKPRMSYKEQEDTKEPSVPDPEEEQK